MRCVECCFIRTNYKEKSAFTTNIDLFREARKKNRFRSAIVCVRNVIQAKRKDRQRNTEKKRKHSHRIEMN